MDDSLCKECYDCKSAFSTWRRKHHCRICGMCYIMPVHSFCLMFCHQVKYTAHVVPVTLSRARVSVKTGLSACVTSAFRCWKTTPLTMTMTAEAFHLCNPHLSLHTSSSQSRVHITGLNRLSPPKTFFPIVMTRSICLLFPSLVLRIVAWSGPIPQSLAPPPTSMRMHRRWRHLGETSTKIKTLGQPLMRTKRSNIICRTRSPNPGQ